MSRGSCVGVMAVVCVVVVVWGSWCVCRGGCVGVMAVVWESWWLCVSRGV